MTLIMHFPVRNHRNTFNTCGRSTFKIHIHDIPRSLWTNNQLSINQKSIMNGNVTMQNFYCNILEIIKTNRMCYIKKKETHPTLLLIWPWELQKPWDVKYIWLVDTFKTDFILKYLLGITCSGSWKKLTNIISVCLSSSNLSNKYQKRYEFIFNVLS